MEPSASASPEKREDCLSPLLFGLLWGWNWLVVLVSLVVAIVLSTMPRYLTPLNSVLGGVVQALLMGLPALLLGRFWRNPRYRPLFQTWALANGFTLLLLPARLVDGPNAQAQALLHVLLSLVFSLVLLDLARQRFTGPDSERRLRLFSLLGQRPWPQVSLLAALSMAGLLSLAWLSLGALGSFTDLVLEGLAGLALGLVGALLAEFFLLRPFLETTPFPRRLSNADFWLGGLALNGMLLILANSLGYRFGLIQFLLVLLLPALGWAIMGLVLVYQRWDAAGPGAVPEARPSPPAAVELPAPAPEDLTAGKTAPVRVFPAPSLPPVRPALEMEAETLSASGLEPELPLHLAETPLESDPDVTPPRGVRVFPSPDTPPLRVLPVTPFAGPYAGRRWLPLAALIGLAAALPTIFFDADELILVFSATAGEALQWAALAGLISGVTGLLFGAAFWLWMFGHSRSAPDWIAAPLPHPDRRPRLVLLTGLVLSLVLASGLLYFGLGQPGFYGERMFVVLKDQANLDNAARIDDYAQRRAVVYGTLVQHADESQAELRRTLTWLRVDYRPFYLVNGIDLPANPLLRLWLLTRPEVDRVLDSPRMRPLFLPLPASSGSAPAPTEPDWNLTLIHADQVWNEFGITGQGVVIGQSDSGVDGTHPELLPSYRGLGQSNDYNWYDPWNGTTLPTDAGYHGTHTLGSIVGQTTGVAPGAAWIGCAHLPRNQGNPSYYLECLQFMLAPFPQTGNPLLNGDPARGANVLNNSWGCPDLEGCDPLSLQPAVHALRVAGVFVEVSAGNDGPICRSLDTPMAIYDEVYTTGAVNSRGNLAFFSSLGPVVSDGSGRTKPDIVAPGENVLSAMPNGTYGLLSGTSMAGPHVAGVVALMWSANPELIGDIQRTEQILNETARPYTGAVPDCPGASDTPSTAFGYGLVDAYKAVQHAIQER